jgi:ribonuclease VapC
MILDSSAVIAALAGEERGDELWQAITGANELRMSAFNVFECRIVLKRQFEPGLTLVFETLLEDEVAIEAFDARQAELAYAAYLKFGKGSGHRAKLNMGDCAAYALARSLDHPLLYAGNDFVHTDVRSAL